MKIKVIKKKNAIKKVLVKLFFLCLFPFLTLNSYSQKNVTISGVVTDSSSGETLLGASVFIKSIKKGTVSNEYGFYSMTFLEGNYTLYVAYLGYKSKEIIISLTEKTKLNIELQEENNQLNEIVITTTNNSKSQVNTILAGVSNLKSKEIKKIPAFFGEPDITRVVLTQPGVNTIGEGTTGFNVRGGNIDQNLILLDEAPIYNSSHLWGFFSVFNTDAVKDLKLYKGSIPARFGGRASSVLDIRQKNGNQKEFKGEGGLGLLFSRITLQGPIKKEKVSFLVSGRRSYFDFFFPLLGDEVKDNTVYFYDLNTKLTWNINSNNKLFASGYFGADVLKLSLDNENDPNNSNDPNDPNTPNTSNDSNNSDTNINFQWRNTTGTLRWNHLFSDKLFMNLSAIYSSYNYILSSENDTGGGPAKTSGTFDWDSTIENWIFKPDFTYYYNISTKIRFGVNNTLYKFTPAKVNAINTVEFQIENGLEIAPYFEYEKKWNTFSLNAGLRYSWFGNFGPYDVSTYDSRLPTAVNTVSSIKNYKSGETTKSYAGFEPRLAINYQLKENKALKFGYNKLFQYIHLISNTAAALPFDIWKPSGEHIKPLEVNQFSAGYAYDTRNKIYNFSLEMYYKTFKNIIEYKNGANLFLNENIETQLLPAKGHSSGLEIGVYKNKGKLTGNINYTYSVTKRKTTSEFASENINGGDYFPSNYDRPNVANLTIDYNLGKKWSLGSHFTYQTGRPTTQATGKFIINEEEFISYSNRNAYRISDTHRMDLSFTYIPTGNKNTKLEGSWNFGIYNVYGRKNAFSTYSSFSNEQFKTYQFSVIGSPIPFITYNFKF